MRVVIQRGLKFDLRTRTRIKIRRKNNKKYVIQQQTLKRRLLNDFFLSSDFDESLNSLVDVLGRMRGRDLDPDPSLTFGHDREAEPDHVNALG